MKSRKQTHQLTFSTDPDGTEVVGVRIANVSKLAWINKTDYDAFVERHGDCAWFETCNRTQGGYRYIRFKCSKTGYVRTVAREIIGSSRRTVISYGNHDHCDLRESNLLVSSGHGGIPKKRKAQSSPKKPTPKRAWLYVGTVH